MAHARIAAELYIGKLIEISRNYMHGDGPFWLNRGPFSRDVALHCPLLGNHAEQP
jgi:hypothetical protein